MNAVNHTQPAHQTNAQKVATNTPTKEPPKAQMGSRQCCNAAEMYLRSLSNNFIGGVVTVGASLLASTSYSLLTQDDPDYIYDLLLGAYVGIPLAYSGMAIHHVYLLKKYIVPEVTRISNAPDTARTESAVKDCNV